MAIKKGEGGYLSVYKISVYFKFVQKTRDCNLTNAMSDVQN